MAVNMVVGTWQQTNIVFFIEGRMNKKIILDFVAQGIFEIDESEKELYLEKIQAFCAKFAKLKGLKKFDNGVLDLSEGQSIEDLIAKIDTQEFDS